MLHGRYKIDNTSPLRIRRSYSICKKLRISAAILAEQTELLEIVTYGFAAHQRAHHIGVVGVGHVPHPRGHPPAEGGVHEFNKLFVERKVIQKLGKKSPKLWFNSSKYLRFIWFNSRK